MQPTEVSIPFKEIIFRDIRIVGSLVSSRDQMAKMLETVVEHKITVKTNPVHGIKEIPKLVELAHSGKMSGKGVVIIDEEAIKKEKESGLTML
jgi:alcohol dehydrogenase, propanol-preferring